MSRFSPVGVGCVRLSRGHGVAVAWVLAIGGGFLGAWLLGEALAKPRELDPLQEIRDEPFFASLQSNSLDLQPRAGIDYDGKMARALAVSVPVYRGGLSEPRVSALIAAGRGDSLEWRLGEAVRRSVREHLADLDRAIWDVTQSIVEEEALVLARIESQHPECICKLANSQTSERQRFERTFLAQANPLIARRQATTASRIADGVTRYFLIKRTDFPVYWEYLDQQHELIRERRRRAGRFIADLFAKQGLEVFASDAAARRS